MSRSQPPDLGPLRALWERAQREPEAIVAAAESRAAERRFTKSLASRERDLEPLWHEREGLSRGRWLKQPRKGADEDDEYGLDDRGRVVLARRHYGGEISQSCVLFAGGHAEGYMFDGRLRPVWVRRYRLSGDRVDEASCFSPDQGVARDRFEYGETGRVVSILVEREEPPQTTIQRVSYSADGDLAAIVGEGLTGLGAGRTWVAYENVEPEEAAALEHELPVELAAAIRARFGATRFEHPPWALALHWQSGLPLPPEVVVGTVPPEGLDLVDRSNPAEWTGDEGLTLRLEDRDLLERCRRLSGIVRPADDAVARTRALMERIVAELAPTDWRALSNGAAVDPFSVLAIPVDEHDP